MTDQYFKINKSKIDQYIHSDKALFTQVFADLVRAEVVWMIDEPLLSRAEWEATIDPDVLLLEIEKRIDTAGQAYWLTEDLAEDIIHAICNPAAVGEETHERPTE